MELEDIKNNLNKVVENVNLIKNKMHLSYDVTIIGVTKTQPDEVINYVKDNNLFTDLGENYIQEFVHKYDLAPNLNWHTIGQLQSNKVKYIIDKTCLIHSLDRDSLAKEINKQAVKHDKIMDCLIELNMGSELSKGGINPNELINFARYIDDNYQNIRLRGVMAIMPNLGKCDKLADLYKKFYDDFLKLKLELNQSRHKIDIRSCGMTNDYEYAIEFANSTHIRIGRAIFGARK